MDVVVIHGYSSNAKSIQKSLGATLLKANAKLGAEGIDDLKLFYADYVSLDDQVMLEDVTESLYFELKNNGFLSKGERSIRFVVHSTGGLVVRQLLSQYAWLNIHTLVHSIIFLAPANFGSPLAHKGKSQLGRLKTIAVDGLFAGDSYVSEWQFGEVGAQILTDLELAAPRQWALSDYDLFNASIGPLYGPDLIHAWVVAGTKSSGITSIVSDTSGTDGVIVTSGAGLNVRRLYLDLVHPESNRTSNTGWSLGMKKRDLPYVPQMIINDMDHETILTDVELAEMVIKTLSVNSPAEYQSMITSMQEMETARNKRPEQRWQQFVLRVSDDRGRPVLDYDLSFNVWNKTMLRRAGITPEVGTPLFASKEARAAQLSARDNDLTQVVDKRIRSKAHTHSTDPQYRRFLVNVDELENSLGPDNVLTASLIATSPDKRIHYATQAVNELVVHPKTARQDPGFFMRDTTTQIDFILDRYSDKGTIVNLVALK